MLENIRCIGFDADDTLWENELFYAEAEEGFIDVMKYSDKRDLSFDYLARTEEKNMACLGYGAKAMTISMIEAAIAMDPNIPSDKILKLIEIGKKLFAVPTEMRPYAVEVLHALQKRYRVVIITKGELNEQQRKFNNSPLDKNIDYFVLDNKTADTYRHLLEREKIDIHSFLMVGNSPKSDILPILDLGGYAAHIPSNVTWVHEQGILPEHPRLLKPKNIREILDLLNLS